jgi:hypothetical protein
MTRQAAKPTNHADRDAASGLDSRPVFPLGGPRAEGKPGSDAR